MPVRDTAIATDASENLKQLESSLDRKDTLEQNLARAYALIVSTYCNKTMQN
jgi:hypothetical protein